MQHWAMALRFDRGLPVVALNKCSAISFYRYGLLFTPSLLIWNKLSNECSAFFMGQMLLSELWKKLPKKLKDLGLNGH